jgi:hypothetical protein
MSSTISQMPTQPPKPKAVREGYAPSPFFFKEDGPRGRARLVAWTPDLAQVSRLFEHLVALLPDQVEILMKIEREEPDDSPETWDRFFGACPRSLLQTAIMKCSAFVYQDSRCQLMVRDPESREYIVLDEVGVVYVYSTAEKFRQAFLAEQFEERAEPLIRTGPHWRQRIPDGEALIRRFVAETGVHQIDEDGSATPADKSGVH